MKTRIFISAIAIAGIGLQACQNTNRTADDPDSLTTAMVDSSNAAMENTAGMNSSDTSSFMHKAAIGGMMEVDLGKMAHEKASNARVKEFGSMMVRDHSKANEELKSLASAKQVILPSTYPADVQSHIDEMKKLDGAAFDKHYMSMMLEDHAKDIELFRNAAKDSDTSISAFATKTLPVLVTHQKKAKEVSATLK